MPATPLEAPLDEADILSRAMKAVAATVFPVEKRMTLVSFALDEYERFRREGQPAATAEDALASLSAPLAPEDPIEDLIQRGQARSGDEAIPPERAESNSPAVWCVVANVVDDNTTAPMAARSATATSTSRRVPRCTACPHNGATAMRPSKSSATTASHTAISKSSCPHGTSPTGAPISSTARTSSAEIDLWWDGTAASRQRAEEIAQMCRERETARNQSA